MGLLGFLRMHTGIAAFQGLSKGVQGYTGIATALTLLSIREGKGA